VNGEAAVELEWVASGEVCCCCGREAAAGWAGGVAEAPEKMGRMDLIGVGHSAPVECA